MSDEEETRLRNDVRKLTAAVYGLVAAIEAIPCAVGDECDERGKCKAHDEAHRAFLVAP